MGKKQCGRRILCPARSMLVVDIENMCGTGRFSEPEAQAARRRVEHLANQAPGSHVVIGASSSAGILLGGRAWPSARRVWRIGPNGADRALIQVLHDEDVAHRFTKVFIASGDHTFADPVRDLKARGAHVTVIARPGSLARDLADAADVVLELPEPRDEP